MFSMPSDIEWAIIIGMCVGGLLLVAVLVKLLLSKAK